MLPARFYYLETYTNVPAVRRTEHGFIERRQPVTGELWSKVHRSKLHSGLGLISLDLSPP